MNRNDAMYKILKFGREEQHKFIKEDRPVEAYQIECARTKLIYCLNSGTIKAVREKLEKMTDRIIDEEGRWHYDAASFVFDNFTRDLLVTFKNNF